MATNPTAGPWEVTAKTTNIGGSAIIIFSMPTGEEICRIAQPGPHGVVSPFDDANAEVLGAAHSLWVACGAIAACFEPPDQHQALTAVGKALVLVNDALKEVNR